MKKAIVITTILLAGCGGGQTEPESHDRVGAAPGPIVVVVPASQGDGAAN